MAAEACPCCGAQTGLRPLYALEDIPVQSTVLVPDRAAALAFPRGDLSLVWCSGCGFAFNARFDPGPCGLWRGI